MWDRGKEKITLWSCPCWQAAELAQQGSNQPAAVLHFQSQLCKTKRGSGMTAKTHPGRPGVATVWLREGAQRNTSPQTSAKHQELLLRIERREQVEIPCLLESNISPSPLHDGKQPSTIALGRPKPLEHSMCIYTSNTLSVLSNLVCNVLNRLAEVHCHVPAAATAR